MKPIILIGGGGHCRSCIDVIEANGKYNIAGFVDKDKKSAKGIYYPWLGNDDSLLELIAKYKAAIVTVGQIKSASVRKGLFEKLIDLGADLPAIVSPRAYISRHSILGMGSIVMHNALVNTAATIGENCIINSQSLVEHDAEIQSHCHISTGACINGGVSIGEESFVGSGAIIREGVSIGSNCVIAAGSVVFKDVPANSIVRE